jgi:hypothetical protein
MSDITIIRGDDKVYNVTVTDSAGDAFDLTGYTVFFTVKRSFRESDDSRALIAKTLSNISSPELGQFDIILTNSDTDIIGGKYYYDIQLKSGAGTITSAQRANFTILDDVTRRTE